MCAYVTWIKVVCMSHNNNNNSSLLKHCVPVPNGRQLVRTRVSSDGIGAIDVFVIGNEPSHHSIFETPGKGVWMD